MKENLTRRLEGELVVARSGTFLRDGDAVRPLPDKANNGAKLSETRR